MSEVALSEDELFDVTHKHRPTAQCRALKSMGIIHKRRPDGTVLVHRSHLDGLLGCIANAKLSPKKSRINWEN